MNVDGTGRRRLVSGDIGEIVWSPDGRQLAFVSGLGLDLIRLDGRARRRITSNGKWPKWSPDGRIFFFRDSPPRTYVARPRGRVTRFPQALLYDTAFSPDGERIAHWDEQSERLILSNARGVRLRTLPVLAGGEPFWTTNLAWSPRGDVLAVAAGGPALLVTPAGSIRRRITIKCCPVLDVAWSGDGRRLVLTGAYSTDENEEAKTNLWIAAADGSAIRRLTQPPEDTGAAVWVPARRWEQMISR